MQRKFKIGVSDWTLYFGDTEVKILTLTKELVCISADGLSNIHLYDACFIPNLVQLLKDKAQLTRVVQSFDLYINDEDKKETITYEYENLKIKNISTLSHSDGIADVDIYLVSKNP